MPRSVIRVNSQAEINRIIAQKRKEMEAKRDINRKEKEVLNVLRNRGGGGEAEEGGKDGGTGTDSATDAATATANSVGVGRGAQQAAPAAKTKPTKPKKIDAETGLECVDKDEKNCPQWATAGECKKNRNFMSVNCKLSCDRCHIVRMKDQNDISEFISRKNKETAKEREDKKRAREIIRTLQEGTGGSAGRDEL